MHKLWIGAALMVALTACGGQQEQQNETTDSEPAVAEQQETMPAGQELSEAEAKGKKLMEMSTCPTCHMIDAKLVGPAYIDVAERYAEEQDTTVTYLAGKVIQGGKGNWGEVPMTPNPQISQEEAEQMVRYILTLNDQE